MSAKRSLPVWMVASDDKGGKEKQIRGAVKRKPEIHPDRCGRRKSTRRVMYWMNEQELVETALSVLERENRETAAADRCAPSPTETTVIPETDYEETTDSEVSEAAVDIAEQETVPYSKCSEERRCSSASESSDERRRASSVVLEKEVESEKDNSRSDYDHEALQVLREIFFS